MRGQNAKYNNPEWIGQKFGRLTVLEVVHVHENWEWRCICDCGNEVLIKPAGIFHGKTQSCGCLAREKAIALCKSRMHKHPTTIHKKLWWKYTSIKRRCNNPNFSRYADYGGRGIKICDEWNDSFDAFAEWAYANGYEDGLTIERIDVNGNYCPENCIFITMEEQAKNKRNTIWVDYNGERIQLRELCRREGKNYDMIKYRIEDMGWSIERAIQEPSSKEKYSLAQKCRDHNIPFEVVKDRINKLGWDEERALTTPVRKISKPQRESA